jgi:hypothetical protein
MNFGRAIGKVQSASFSPDGRHLLLTLAWGDGGWPSQPQALLDVPQPVRGSPEHLRLWIEVITATEQDASGEVTELDHKTWQQRHDRLQKLGGPP